MARARTALVPGLLLLQSILPTGECYRLITFDLDDTLWPTAPVVASANAKLCAAFEACGVPGITPWDVQSTMKRLRPELEAKSAGVPPTYTALRTAAIAHLLASKVPQSDLQAIANELFQVWLRGRHDSAEAHLFSGALEAATSVRKTYPEATIVALTNGRGDPLAMSEDLASCFDFTVSGEEPSIHPHRKPSPVIFRAALERAGVDGDSFLTEHAPAPEDSWVHIGDDLLNDIAAAKGLGAFTVWLDLAAEAAATAGVSRSSGVPDSPSSVDKAPTLAATGEATYSTLDPAERLRREAQRAAVPLSHIDQRIQTIGELPAALEALGLVVSARAAGAGSK
mmetsp:Transcript_17737/g.45848  ORF Transcript_17737/g.45848 Transcript_17737/m.45848 type:complete len:340 (+) Transcript_17737:42-1061(+)